MAKRRSGITRFKQSLVDEIIESMEKYLLQILGGDDHFSENVFRSKRDAAHYAVANMLAHVKVLKEYREHARKRNIKLKP